jgi:hypothetical protein
MDYAMPEITKTLTIPPRVLEAGEQRAGRGRAQSLSNWTK